MFSLFGGRPSVPPGDKDKDEDGQISSSSRPQSVTELIQGQTGGATPAPTQSLVNFDPTGLERAAKAARDLDASRNSKEAIDIALSQERTKQVERQAQAKEAEVQAKLAEIRRIQVLEEERRKTIELETSHINHRNKQQDELARRRMQEQHENQVRLQDDLLRKQEESIKRQEAMKKQTIEYEKELERKNDKAKIDAEIEGKIKYERENRLIHVENMKIQAAELRDTTLQAIKLAGETIGSGLKEFLDDKKRVTAVVTGLSLLALGVYGARTSTGVIGKYIESRMGKPNLVRETSRQSLLSLLRDPLQSFKRWRNSGQQKDVLAEIVLNNSLTDRMRQIAWTTINSQRNRAPFRNILLHGPPGTGKTMFSKSLALNSGMDFAILTGADVAPLGKEAVTELHKLFDWANNSKRGLVLFIDEADAFLRKRNTAEISEDMRNALNAFLYRTGESSKKFMVILASNQPEQLDWAINDRVDEIVEFGLPGETERERLIEQYFEKYIQNHHIANKTKPIHVVGISNDDLRQIAKMTQGFSGRELSKLVIAWQAAAFGALDGSLTHPMMMQVLEQHKAQHNQKTSWQKK